MKKILSVLLILMLLFETSACNKNKEVDNNDKQVETISDNIDSDLIPDYVHYDPSKFNNDIDRLNKAIEDKDIDLALELYDSLYNEMILVSDYDTIAYLNFCIDYTDELWSSEYDYSDALYYELDDKLKTLGHKLCVSSFANDFKKHLNFDQLYNDYLNYVPNNDEVLDLINRENELVKQYMALDYDNNFYNSCSDIYLELVQIRDKIAKAKGYENYALYADTELYARDYKEEELNNFYKAVKDMDYDALLDLNATINAYDYSYYVDGEHSLVNLQSAINGVSSIIQEAYDYMLEHKLYWFDNSNNNYNVGFTTSLMQSGVSYIFYHLGGYSSDYTYQVHELGHFANYYLNHTNNVLFYHSSYDLSEIQSQGLELLCNKNILEKVGLANTPAEYSKVVAILQLTSAGCLFDEWQRKIYQNPDMSIEEIDQLFNELTIEYGINTGNENYAYWWRTVSHNFESPMYYISYGTSAFAALQIWYTSLNNFDLAVSQYESILKMSTEDIAYKEALKQSNMIMFDDYDQVSAILQGTIDLMKKDIK